MREERNGTVQCVVHLVRTSAEVEVGGRAAS